MVNPHFAFPVVGVVICAVLVFAFGFKSPVQPPSFDFGPEAEKRAKKTKQKKVCAVLVNKFTIACVCFSN